MRWVAFGASNGLLAVVAGAFGAHALRDRVTPSLLAAFETGARYHAYHALALLGLGLLARAAPSRWVVWSGAFFSAGILLFSGSLYALSLSGLSALGAVTPIGGLALMAGWGFLALAALRPSAR
ncbi:MAG: DUF423 domain-containing protein [Myxococcaceae bacterium]